ncbi:unnamed protein product [Peronospora destructor]|uniref:MBD domain-containing protein n=1 Tax=Peronospora destructor TaxID=86335 RepID=A0AAV0V9S5_9STRA|nr:unnamed protein product [Peronospora destructor]
MDSMDLQRGNVHTEDNVAPIVHERMIPKRLAQLEQEEKREDNSSSNGNNSDDDAEQDMDFPTTQVLANDIADSGMQIKLLGSPLTIRSPVKTCASPAKPRKSPVKAPASSDKANASPVKARASPVKLSSLLKGQSPSKLQFPSVKTLGTSVAPSPIVERPAQEEAVDDTPEEFRAKGAEGKFTKVFPAVSKLVETGGWQTAHGHNTLFCAMPGVQFFNFKPNINVFDSKVKACWKFIQIAGEKEDDTEDKALWEMLWPIAEKEFGWFTMMCGPETWFAKPNTRFENFQPNKTIFQTKKRAVLKCLSVTVGGIELGDSCEGHQVITFAPHEVQLAPAAPKKVKTSLFKTPSPATKQTSSRPSSSAKFVTPAKHVSPSSATSSTKRKLSSSASKLSSKSSVSKKKVKTGTTASPKKATTKKKRKSISDPGLDISKGDDFKFTPPEFRCSFGIVYAKLQDEGWYHRSGTFEYDYFSPTYTDATKKNKVNFFQSQADLEEYLKVSGTWSRIENELHEEHERAVDEEREKALDRHHQRLEQQAARKRNLALHGPLLAAAKPKKLSKKVAPKKGVSASLVPQSLYEAEVKAARAAEAEEARLSRMPSLKFGTVLQKLVKRGWYYRPGRFEYDYFKPSANPKSAVAGEDRFESASALEVYLKTTGLWEEIAEEVAHEEPTERNNGSASFESQERLTKRYKLESPPPTSAPSPKKALNGGVQKGDVKAITNDIWANSHEFDFNE